LSLSPPATSPTSSLSTIAENHIIWTMKVY
jgi:hypothetical protein